MAIDKDTVVNIGILFEIGTKGFNNGLREVAFFGYLKVLTMGHVMMTLL